MQVISIEQFTKRANEVSRMRRGESPTALTAQRADLEKRLDTLEATNRTGLLVGAAQKTGDFLIEMLNDELATAIREQASLEKHLNRA